MDNLNWLGILGFALAILDIFFKRASNAIEDKIDRLPDVIQVFVIRISPGIANAAMLVATVVGRHYESPTKSGEMLYVVPEEAGPRKVFSILLIGLLITSIVAGLFWLLVSWLGTPTSGRGLAILYMVTFVPIFFGFCLLLITALLAAALLVRAVVSGLNAITRGNALAAIGLTIAFIDLIPKGN